MGASNGQFEERSSSSNVIDLADEDLTAVASAGRGAGERGGFGSPSPPGGISQRRAGLGQREWGGQQQATRDGSNG
ncbi:unnamed protein product, partial [Ectocarpus fasciculatus]